MDRFMIGQFGYFNEEKYKRDFRQGFYGIEASLLREEKDVDRLIELAKQDLFHIGVHFPLRSWRLATIGWMNYQQNRDIMDISKGVSFFASKHGLKGTFHGLLAQGMS